MSQKLVSEVTHWALLIGINHYSDPKEDLRGCVNDANVMKQYLESSIGPKLNVVSLSATASTICPGPPSEDKKSWPTYANVVKNLESIADLAKRGDRVFVYFAGHGTYIEKSSTPALLVLPDNGCGKRALRITGLYSRIEKMIAKGLTVTLALDCCYSGAVVRGDGQEDIRIRGLDFNSTVIEDAESTKPCFLGSETTRDATMEHNWLEYATGLVVLCACAPQERTFEAKLEGKIQGLFTHFLLHALNMLVKDGIDITHTAVHERLSISLRAYWPQQTPMRYGKADDVLFGDSLLAPAKSPLVVYRDKSGALRLRAGEVHGIVKGDEFYASSLETTKAEQVANVRTTEVRAVESDLEAIDRLFEESTVREWKAKPLSSLASRIISVGIPPELASGTRTISQEDFRYLRLVDRECAPLDGTGESYAYSVIINGHDQYEIVDPMRKRVFPIPTIHRSSDDAPQLFRRILQHIADFKYFEGLENRTPCPKIQGSLRIVCSISAESSNRINVMHGEKITFSFTNTGEERLYVGIFDLSTSWQVSAMTSTGFKIIPAREGSKNGTARVTMQMEVPEYFNGVTSHQCEDHIKFLISNTATHFRWALPTIFETIQATNESHRGEDNGLQASLAGFLGEFRGSQEGKWATRSFFVRTKLAKVSLDPK
ncbi:hypothetical protein E8E12_002500 [Didymella heteroderae]|uniref:Peptidase C14 caspase domain-containing protein n=1 Tax=Didymella heteroderae TaxID=1769908 RepID=A0A9P5BYW9_9PLEO|nr:hypothetical protein E8E12_002500 [Didymella heteroderae]